MRVLYDHQIFALQNFGGISRYFVEIFKELKFYQDLSIEYSIAFSNNEYLNTSSEITVKNFLKNIDFKGKRTLMIKMNEFHSRRAIHRNNYDIFHPTYYDEYHLKINKKPLVLTCYDLIHEKYLPQDKTTLKQKKIVLKEASKIIAISQHTKNDLIEYHNLSKEQIEVIYLASSLKVKEKNSLNKEANPKPYFLYVGNRSLYKNFTFFVESIQPLLAQSKDLILVCAGGGNFTSEELRSFTKFGLDDKVFFHTGSDENLVKLYSEALAFFFPSLYEGFGIPILEAMSCGCPVLASNTSSLPEVGGDAAFYFDPLDKHSIYSAAKGILDDSSLRLSLQSKGLERTKLFSWETAALKTHNLYRTLL